MRRWEVSYQWRMVHSWRAEAEAQRMRWKCSCLVPSWPVIRAVARRVPFKQIRLRTINSNFINSLLQLSNRRAKHKAVLEYSYRSLLYVSWLCKMCLKFTRNQFFWVSISLKFKLTYLDTSPCSIHNVWRVSLLSKTRFPTRSTQYILAYLSLLDLRRTIYQLSP